MISDEEETSGASELIENSINESGASDGSLLFWRN